MLHPENPLEAPRPNTNTYVNVTSDTQNQSSQHNEMTATVKKMEPTPN